MALRIVYDPTTQAGENGRLSLFVDGHSAWNGWGSGKKPASAQSRSVKLRGSMRIGRVHNPESAYPGQSNYVDLDKLKAKDAAAYGKWNTYLKQSPRWLNAVADIDDVRVYQGPLSRAELARLVMLRKRGVRLQVPDFDAPRALLSWSDGATQSGAMVPVEGFQTELKGLPLASSSAPVDVARIGASDINVEKYHPGTVRGQLSHMRGHTLVAWLKVPDEDVDLLKYTAKSGGWSWTLRASKGRKLKVACGNGASGTATHPASSKAWIAVSVSVTDAGKLTLTRNFQEALLADCGALPESDDTATLKLLRPDKVSVAWLHVLDAARSLGQVNAIGSPGPVRHLRPPSLTDLSGLHDSAASGTTEISIPLADTAAGETPRAAERPFTLVETFTIPTSGAFNQWYFTRRGDSTGFDADVAVQCDANHCATRLWARNPTDKNKVFNWSPTTHFNRGVETRLAFTDALWRAGAKQPDGQIPYALQPIVALNGVLLTTGGGYDNPVGAFDDPGYANNSLPSTVAGAIILTSPSTVSDIRIYGYTLQSPERIGATCAELACEKTGRVCVAPAAGSHGSAYCGGCDASHWKVGGVTGYEADCEPKLGFQQPCMFNGECKGACLGADLFKTSGSASKGGLCAAPDVATCEQTCHAAGRACVYVGYCGDQTVACGPCLDDFIPMDPWDKGDDQSSPWPTSVCSSSSTFYYKVPDPNLTCQWKPTYDDGALYCQHDSQCKSGKCKDVQTQYRHYVKTAGIKNNTPYAETAMRVETQKVCGHTDKTECTTLPVRSVVASQEVVKPPDGSKAQTVYFCSYGEYGQCQPNYERRAQVLSWQACKTGATIFWGTQYARYQAFVAKSGLTVDRLRLAFLNQTGPQQTGDIAKLIEAGVGPLLLRYAEADQATKQKMASQYGAFEPLALCEDDFADDTQQKWIPEVQTPDGKYVFIKATPYHTTAYGWDANSHICAAKLQPNGASCPPKGEENSTVKPNRWCRSDYCRRDTHVCDVVEKAVSKLKGQGGNQSKKGEKAVAFGIVRHETTKVELKENAATKNTSNYKYDAWIKQKHVSCMFGSPFPSVPLFELDMHLDRSKGSTSKDCAKTEVYTHVVGLQTSAPAPGPVAGSCTGIDSGAGAGWDMCASTVTTCTEPDLSKWADNQSVASQLPTSKFCVPVDMSEYEKSWTQFIGPVPLTVKMGPTVDLCIGMMIGVDGSGLPQLEVAPTAALGVEVRGGVGFDSPIISVFAGVKLALTLVGVRVPVTFGMAINDVFTKTNGQDQQVLGMLELQLFSKIALELSVLNGEFSLFAEMSFAGGLFVIEKTLPLFTWTAFKWTYNLLNEPLKKWTFDFQAEFVAALKGPAQAVCNSNLCYQ